MSELGKSKGKSPVNPTVPLEQFDSDDIDYSEYFVNSESYVEPEVNMIVRATPRGNTSTRRDPSVWEYSERGRGRPRSSSSSRGRGCISLSSVHNASTYDVCRTDITAFDYVDKIPGIILPFVVGYLDVVGDGNCGFRVVADYIFGDQEQWQIARVCIANEILAKRILYQPIYYDGIDHDYRRIMWDGGTCHQDHWMTVTEDLFPIANVFNAAVMYFGFGSGGSSLFACFTVLPLQAPSTATRPSREIVFGHLGDRYKHYIRLNLSLNFPVPPIVTSWFSYRQSSVVGWEKLYERRRAHWDRLVELM